MRNRTRKKVIPCPECGSKNTKRNGKLPSGSQKHVCFDCGFFFLGSYYVHSKKYQDLNTEILKLWEQGLSMRKIAEQLGCVHRTVSLRLKSIKKVD